MSQQRKEQARSIARLRAETRKSVGLDLNLQIRMSAPIGDGQSKEVLIAQKIAEIKRLIEEAPNLKGRDGKGPTADVWQERGRVNVGEFGFAVSHDHEMNTSTMEYAVSDGHPGQWAQGGAGSALLTIELAPQGVCVQVNQSDFVFVGYDAAAGGVIAKSIVGQGRDGPEFVVVKRNVQMTRAH